MDIILKFQLNPYRVYSISKKTNKGIAAFPRKPSSSYLDYSVDFSRRLQDGERIITGIVTIINGMGLIIQAVVCNGPYLTAFIDEGDGNNSYYLSFQAQSNLGGLFIQDMVLPVIGEKKEKREEYSFLACTEKINSPNTRPPLNAIRINGRYLISDSGFFMGI